MNPLIAIVGPTAVGKTALSLEVAPALGGEIVNADSRQVYRYLDVGTAKPTPEERARVPHHLVDVVDPDQTFTLADFQTQATAAIEAIHRRGKVPLLVGGTGLYVWAIVEGLSIPRVPPNEALRRALETIGATEEGKRELYRRLEGIDPAAAGRIDWRNVRRTIRALEVYQATGVPFSQLGQRHPPPYRIFLLGLTVARPELYRRIDRRAEAQVAGGLVEETRWLLDRGYGWDLPAMTGLGYREIGQYLRGEVTRSQAVDLIKHHTHRFARQQYTWFRLADPRIAWFEAVPDYEPAALRAVTGFLRGEPV